MSDTIKISATVRSDFGRATRAASAWQATSPVIYGYGEEAQARGTFRHTTTLAARPLTLYPRPRHRR